MTGGSGWLAAYCREGEATRSGVTPYVKSKTLAERAVWDFVNDEGAKTGLELAVVNPVGIFGPCPELAPVGVAAADRPGAAQRGGSGSVETRTEAHRRELFDWRLACLRAGSDAEVADILTVALADLEPHRFRLKHGPNASGRATEITRSRSRLGPADRAVA